MGVGGGRGVAARCGRRRTITREGEVEAGAGGETDSRGTGVRRRTFLPAGSFERLISNEGEAGKVIEEFD